MTGKALWSGLKSYLAALLTVVLFPILWARSLRLARRHKGDDPRAPAKVAAAIVASVVILAGGALVLTGFQASARAGMYDSLDTRLAAATGESEYQDNVAARDAADVTIPIIERNLAAARAGNDTAKAESLQAALNATRESRDKAAQTASDLAPNHQLYLSLGPSIDAQDDDAIRGAVSGSGLAYPEAMQADTEAALAIKDQAVDDMRLMLWLFAWPSLFGAFLAPLAFAYGSILARSFVPSDTVGFKPYPGAAAGFFLLFGAFGLPSIPFAAWVYLDAESRSREGQIAL